MWLTADEAAKALRVSRIRVHQLGHGFWKLRHGHRVWVAGGKLRTKRAGYQWLYHAGDVEARAVTAPRKDHRHKWRPQ